MAHTPRRFVEQAMPIGDFFKSLSRGYPSAYEYYRDQNMYIQNSAADPSEINLNEPSVWGLKLTEVKNDNNIELLKKHIIYATLEQAVSNRDMLLGFFRDRPGPDSNYAETAFRNLTNAWRDEYCLNAPVNACPEERMKTAEWRITMCYYALYKSAAAILRTKDNSDPSKSHRTTLNKHSNQFMASQVRCLYGYPFNFAPSSDQFFDFRLPFPLFEGIENRKNEYAEHHQFLMETLYSKAEDISTWDGDRDTDTFYHVFKLLREWATYEHGGIFSRLYGEGYIKYIDRSIRLLAHSAISTAEVALICSFGIDKFGEEVEYYRDSCEEGVSEAEKLITERYEVYKRVLGDF